MTVPFPIDLIAPDGTPCQAHSPVELNDLLYGHGYQLRRGVTGLDGVAVAEPVRAAQPREVMVRRTPAGTEAPVPDPAPTTEPGLPDPAPSPRAPARRSTRKD